MNKNKKLIVVAHGYYPYGDAATNRHLAYLKGLVELGVEVKILIVNNNKKGEEERGTYNGIKYEYTKPNKYNIEKLSIIKKGIRLFLNIRDVKKKLKQEYKNNKDIKILVLAHNAIILYSVLKFTKPRRVIIFKEMTEYPFVVAYTLHRKLLLKFYYKQISKIDGLFVITKALKEYFKDYISETKIHHIPMCVEPERFAIEKKKSDKYGRYIAYCGSMYTDKDGVPILVEAFSIFAETNKDINLVLIGNNSDKKGFKQINDTIKKSKYKNRIFLTGWVSKDKIPELLKNADALALARPNNKQAEGGFPTKLGEYLATGNPVVVTAVGEIPNYLVNNKNAYVCKADSPNAFANALNNLFNDYNKAKEIGIKGKELVYNEFNYKVQANRIFKYLFK